MQKSRKNAHLNFTIGTNEFCDYIKDIEIGNWYHISGDIDNGTKDGKPYTSHDEVTRRIKRVTDTHIICECDRKFLINDNLKLSIPAFRRTDMANS